MAQRDAHRHPGAFSTTVHSTTEAATVPQGIGSSASSDFNDIDRTNGANASPPSRSHEAHTKTSDPTPTISKPTSSNRHVSDEFDVRPKKSKRSGGFLLSSNPTSLKRRFASNIPEKAGRIPSERNSGQSVQSEQGSSINGTAILPSQEDPDLAGRFGGATQEYTPPRTPVYNHDDLLDIKGKKRISSSQRSDRHSAEALASSETSSRSAPRPFDGAADLQHQRPRPASIDASQLVRMALSLSESRKQQLSPGQLASLPSPSNRVISIGGPPPTATWTGPSDSLPSTASTPSRRPIRAAQSPGLSLQSESSQPSPANPAFPTLQHYEYQLSTSTLLRADKAKAHFELFHDYLRLLEFLPPLRASTSSISSSGPPLGRKYNPLQFIRNRRVRARERQTLDSAATGWTVPMDVKQWVNAVQLWSTKENYVAGDRVRLPTWNAPSLTAEAANNLTEIRSKAEATQKQWRPLINWSVAQEDLLADTYWVEEDRHKALIETNQGAKVFPTLRIPTPPAKQHDEDDSELRDRPDFAASSESPEYAEHKSGDQRGRGLFHPWPGTASRKGRVKRQLLGRHSSRLSDTASDISESDEDNERNPRLRSHRTLSSENVGPLERHMNKMLDLEKGKEKQTPIITKTDTHGSDGGRRMGMSEGIEESHSRRGSVARMQTFEEAFAQKRDDALNEAAMESSGSFDMPAQTERADWAMSKDRGAKPNKSIDSWGRSEVSAAPDSSKHRLPRFEFLRRKKTANGQKQPGGQGSNNRVNNIDRNGSKVNPSSSTEPLGSSKSSLETSPRASVLKPERKVKRDNDMEQQPNGKADNATARAIFKSSRVAELAKEASLSGSLARSTSSSRSRQQSPDGERDSSTDRSSHRRGQISLHLPRPSISTHGRSMSADDLHEPRNGSYHGKELPSFVSSHSKSRPGQLGFLKRIDSRLAESRPIRSPPKTPQSPKAFDRVPLLELPDSSEVSPSASTTHLPRQSRRNGPGLAPPLRRNNESDSESDAHSTSSRLQQTLRGSGLRSGIPVTALSGLEANRRRRSSTSPAHRSWSIADTRSVSPGPRPAVTAQDVAYVQTLLVSGGVKARAILARGDAVRDPPAEFYKRAAQACGKTAEPAPVKQEHVLAARMLSEKLQQSISGFETDATRFRSQTTRSLYDQIADLHDHAGTRLTGRVRTGADDADAFVARLTSNHTLAVKQVNDQIDKALRSRRRRVRWLSRAGFSVLEWIVVAVMWWIWGFVLVIRIILGIFTVFWSILRWLLWL